MEVIFLLKSITEAAYSLHFYNKTVAVPLGLRIQRLRCNKGGETPFLKMHGAFVHIETYTAKLGGSA